MHDACNAGHCVSPTDGDNMTITHITVNIYRHFSVLRPERGKNGSMTGTPSCSRREADARRHFSEKARFSSPRPPHSDR